MSLNAENLHRHDQHRRGSAPGPRSPQQGLLSPSHASLSHSQSSPGGFHLDSTSEAGSVHSARRKSTRAPSTQQQNDTENVKVICRVRPFNKREFELHDEMNAKIEHEWDKHPLRSVIEMDGRNTIFLDHEKGYGERDRFGFDASLWSIPDDQQACPNGFCTQEDVMAEIGDPALKHIWNGYNTTVFAYGQTGAGKTFSMMGAGDNDLKGLIPRICKQLFDSVEQKRAEDKENPEEGQVKEYKLEARFLEIYNERVRDLLWAIRPQDQAAEGLDPLNLKIRNIPNVGPQVVGITSLTVDSSEDCLRLIEEGTRHRSVAATKMNAESSRSHSIFRLTLVQTTKILPTKQFEKPKTYDRTSVISLVDLAGSERNKKTGAEGARLKEAVAINQSLTSLKNVIDALVDGRSVIPFRDSQLTWLLSESLGGNSKTFMIACISPHSDNAEESLNTLRYAARAQKIVNHASVNESEEMRRMNKMRDELDRLQKMQNENPNEQLLEEEMEDQRRKLKELQDEDLRRHAEEETLAKQAAKHDSMRFTQGYQHAFRTLLYRRLERRFRDANISAKQKLEVRVQEKATVLSRVQETDATTKELTAKHKAAFELRDDLENRLKMLKQNCEQLEREKGDLVAKEDRLKDSQEKKQQLVVEAKHIGKILCAQRRYHYDQKIEKMNAVHNENRREIADGQVNWNLDAEEKHVERMDQLKQQQDEQRDRLADLKAKLEKTNTGYSDRIGKLHASCIFYENETRRCAPDLERGIATINKACSAKFYQEKEEWAHKINARQAELEKETAVLSEEYQQRSTTADLDTAGEIEKAEMDGKDAYERTIRSNEHRLVELDDTWSKRIKMLDALNVDTEHFLKETRCAEPRYEKLFEEIAYLVDKEKTVDNQIHDIATKLRKVQVRLESIAPQPFKAQSAVREDLHCDPVPLYGQAPTPRRHRTPTTSASPAATPMQSSPTTPRSVGGMVGTPRSVVSAATAAARRSQSPSVAHQPRQVNRDRTQNREGPFATQRRDLAKPKSLDTPSRLIPTTTKTSRLRDEHLLTKQTRATSPSVSRSVTPADGEYQRPQLRSTTPRTARETLSFLLQDEPKKIALGDGGKASSFYVSRSRSPKATAYKPPVNVPRVAGIVRSTTPTTPRSPSTYQSK